MTINPSLRQLQIIGGPDRGRTIPVINESVRSIGRGQACDTIISDPHISRLHCRIEFRNGTPYLVDSGSTGGTFVGDVRIEEYALKHGDSFRIGDSILRYCVESSADATTLGAGFRNPPPTKTPSIESLVGEKLADFLVEKMIAKGSSSLIFRGTDTIKNRPVAIKVLTPDLVRGEEQKERFVRAMKTTLPIRHPNIVRLYNAGKKGPFCWAAMEFVEGESLTKVIQRSGIQNMLDWREVFKVAHQIGSALEVAYQHKIIHRNVTPANIFRRSADKVCLLGDLMLAKGLESADAEQVTQPGQLIGELPYMSPERTQSNVEVDCRSDLYGLGATLYALLAGKPPVAGDSLPTILSNIRKTMPEHPKTFQLSIHDRFADLVMTLLEKSPENRFPTPNAVMKELETIGRYNALVST